ncbi:hypothetical protein FB45DRAFT_868373 [Roridomyces roridus]|uniref:Uncharacterized protein n=1 Tax=Roridomyces roridus TaxID=1738132 RepID=A0AAD7BQL7_9AGAR|nr:hypothetical protein FB45DRAFT_868373 [Roridomyces roridus]
MSATRVIFVSGANQGLGMHTVRQLASTPDVLVFMGSRKLAAAEEALATFASEVHPSSSVVPLQLDITDAASVQNAHNFVSKTLKERNLPGLDVLINKCVTRVSFFQDRTKTSTSAGIASAGPLEIYATNVLGTANLKDALCPLLTQRGSSAILNISSSLGSNTLFTHRPPTLSTSYLWYSTSKAALNSLTVQWALEEEEKGSGIRVVSICPGMNATRINNYTDFGGDPKDGVKVIVKEALLANEGRTAVFIHKDGVYPW